MTSCVTNNSKIRLQKLLVSPTNEKRAFFHCSGNPKVMLVFFCESSSEVIIANPVRRLVYIENWISNRTQLCHWLFIHIYKSEFSL